MSGPILTRRTALAGMAALGSMALASPAWAVGAIKHYILIQLLPGADQLSLDRWYMTYHAPQVRRAFQAWQRDYLSFRSYLPPQEAVARYGVEYGRMTEIHFDQLADFRESREHNLYGGDIASFTPPPGGWRGNSLFRTDTATIPVNPDMLYVSQPTPPRELPYLRWIVFFRYPEATSDDAGDAWWEGAAAILARLPGLRRFGMYRAVIDSDRTWPRVAEFWFDDYAAWKAAFLDHAPALPPRGWGGEGLFPQSVSMFVGENPDIDFIHDDRVIP